MEEATKLIDREQATSPAKAKLKKRIAGDAVLTVSLPSSTNDSGRRKLKVRQALLKRGISATMDGIELDHVLDVIRTLSPKEVDETYLKDFLRKIFT